MIFTPGKYVFKLDYVNYEVELKEGLNILLRSSKASDKWIYSKHTDTSLCKDDVDYRPISAASDDNLPDRLFYGVKYEDETLDVTWYNITDECDTFYHGGIIEPDGDKLKNSPVPHFYPYKAECTCKIDVNATFQGIKPGEYKVVFGKDEFNLDLKEGTDVLLDSDNSFTGIKSFPIETGDEITISRGVLKIDSDNSFVLDIYQVDGGRVVTLSGNSSDEIDLNNLPKGIYVISLTADGRTISRRIIL